MGCSPTRENIESEMLILRLLRTQIQEERIQILNELEKMTGRKIVRPTIPDYILHQQEKENTHQHHPKNGKSKSKNKIKKKQSTKADENELESYDGSNDEEDEK